LNDEEQNKSCKNKCCGACSTTDYYFVKLLTSPLLYNLLNDFTRLAYCALLIDGSRSKIIFKKIVQSPAILRTEKNASFLSLFFRAI
jgi:hypothetical protein